MKILAASGALALAVVLSASAQAQTTGQHSGHTMPAAAAPAMPMKTLKVGSLSIEAPWTRATPAGAKVGGGFMKITNTGKEADRLVGGSMPQAGRFEVHEMAVTNGVMTMRPLEKGLEIKPGQTVERKPGSFHVMFMDLKEPLAQGKPAKGTLKFEKAGTVEVEYHVAPVGAANPGTANQH